jgi:8-oxo-dGTP pyrophosphatase MutT (NUDIX family)
MFICEMSEQLINNLKKRLKQPLPGIAAQRKMANSKRFDVRFRQENRAGARLGSVLIPLYLHEGRLSVVLMKRPNYNGTHSGQVSFPGGKHEKGDPDLQFTALREAHEEVGLPTQSVEVIGQLTDLYIPPSNFLVHPFVGFVRELPKLVPDQHEVELILQPEMRHFFEHDYREKDIQITKDISLNAPYYEVDGHTVWGATAMILAELQQVLRDAGFR